MNPKRSHAIAVAGLSLAAAAHAQFSITWFTIDGGGGPSAGGSFVLSGTLGQPEAAPCLAGGAFKLEPGFWSGVSVQQTPGAPTLKIQLVANGLAEISWPAGVAGFVLEETESIDRPNSWSNTLQPVVTTATEHTVTVPASGNKCFRLKRVIP